MGSCTTALLFDVSAKSEGLSPTARIRSFITTILKLRFLSMISTIRKLTTYELGFAYSTLKGDKSCPNLPIYVFPLDLFLIVHELDESIQIEKSIGHVLCDNLSVKIDEDFSIRTHHPNILVVCIQLATVNASI